MIQQKNETEGLLFSINKNCEIFFKETHRPKQKRRWSLKWLDQKKLFNLKHDSQLKDLG